MRYFIINIVFVNMVKYCVTIMGFWTSWEISLQGNDESD